MAPWCATHHTALVGYSPLGSRGRFPAQGPHAAALAGVAERLGATPRQVALAFLTRDQAFAIPKSSLPAHVDELAGAGDLVLDADAIATIEAAFPRTPWRGLPTL